jgi:hypothetical protein
MKYADPLEIRRQIQAKWQKVRRLRPVSVLKLKAKQIKPSGRR